MLIRFDRRDIRSLQVQTLDGRALGAVYAPRTWQRYAHSLATRKRINRIIREGYISRRDPLGNYFNYTAAHRELPSQALSLVQLSREFGMDTDSPTVEEPMEFADEPWTTDEMSVVEALKALPDWDAGMVRKRR